MSGVERNGDGAGMIVPLAVVARGVPVVGMPCPAPAALVAGDLVRGEVEVEVGELPSGV